MDYDVLQIEGDLTRFVNNSGEETVVHGAVASAEIGNCAEVKGVVDFASAGNRLFCTMGDSRALPLPPSKVCLLEIVSSLSYS